MVNSNYYGLAQDGILIAKGSAKSMRQMKKQRRKANPDRFYLVHVTQEPVGTVVGIPSCFKRAL